MPPHSTSLSQEGAAFKSFLLVQKDRFMEEEVTRAIKDAGGRNLHDNISDLRAQVAANKKGIDLVSNRILLRQDYSYSKNNSVLIGYAAL